jgi:valyl-tRNA synthetase
VESLARVYPLAILAWSERRASKEASVIVLPQAEIVLPWASAANLKEERARLMKEIELSQTRIMQLETRLRDNAFLTKAPAEVIEKEKQKLRLHQVKLEKLEQELSQLA